MEILRTLSDLAEFLTECRGRDEQVGFVPTMGAIHEGHLSLVRASIDEHPVTLVSVFVNPAQFNDESDLENYPRNFEEDAALLEEAGASAIFHPGVDSVYPPGFPLKDHWDFGYLDQPMEGEKRPGHFQGMAKVVFRLLQLVEPWAMYMGQKDYQQFAIVKELKRQEGLHVRLKMCPIVREEHGLAMSSRNELLSPEAREKAALIYNTIADIGKESTLEQAAATFENTDWLELEYLAAVDPDTLQPKDISDTPVVVCVAAVVEGIRLIDNHIIS